MTDGLVRVEYLSAYNGRVKGERRRVDPGSAASLQDRGVVRLVPDGEDTAVPETVPAVPTDPVLPLVHEPADPAPALPLAEGDPDPEF